MEEVLDVVDEIKDLTEGRLMPYAFADKDELLFDESNINYIVLAVDYAGVNTGKHTYDIKLLGKSMVDWVKSACKTTPKVKPVVGEFNVVQEVKELLDEKEWTIVLFSDTPLITSDTIERSFNFASSNGLNVCMLKRGYIFKTEYVKRIEDIYGVENCTINSEDFTQATTFVEISKATTVLKNRINDFHLKNGVYIIDKNSVMIDAEVSIGTGTVIYSGNYIYGTSEIGENVQLFSGNRILNSIIANSAKIESSTISGSVIGEKCKIKNSNIGTDVLIKANTKIQDGAVVKESIIGEECKIMNATIKGAVVNKNSKIFDGARIIGKDGNIVIENNVSIGENSIINDDCVIKEGKKLPAGTLILK